MSALPSLLPMQRVALTARQRDNLYAFLWTSVDILNQDRPERFEPNWHLEALCWELTKVERGDQRRLLVTMPPRHLKTITTSVAFVAWVIGRNPASRIVLVSYGHKLAAQNLADLRRILESPTYRRIFPHVTVRVALPEIITKQGGAIRATSVGGSITGFGADLIIGDDLLNAGDSASAVMRDDAYEFFQHSMVSRLNDKSRGRIVLVQQRLHADDIAGRLMETGTFRVLNLPAIAEEDETIEIGPGRFHHRRTGEALFPQREPIETLNEVRALMGNRVFVPQYQQRTDGAGSDLFQWSWFKTYETRPDRDEFNMVIQSVDTAFGDGADNDWSVCLTFGRKDQDWYLLDVHRTRESYSDFRASLVRLARRWNCDRLIIENAGTGLILLRELLREDRMIGRLERFVPKLSKTERFNTQIERLKTTRFLLPKDAPWLAEFRRELTSFPNGRNDDQVDALTQFLDWLGHRRAIGKMIDADRRGMERRR